MSTRVTGGAERSNSTLGCVDQSAFGSPAAVHDICEDPARCLLLNGKQCDSQPNPRCYVLDRRVFKFRRNTASSVCLVRRPRLPVTKVSLPCGRESTLLGCGRPRTRLFAWVFMNPSRWLLVPLTPSRPLSSRNSSQVVPLALLDPWLEVRRNYVIELLYTMQYEFQNLRVFSFCVVQTPLTC